MKQAAKKFDGEAEHPRERDEENTHAQHERESLEGERTSMIGDTGRRDTR